MLAETWRDIKGYEGLYQYDRRYHLINNYPSVIKASLITGINHGNICSCCEGRRKTAGNYIWSYLKLGGD